MRAFFLIFVVTLTASAGAFAAGDDTLAPSDFTGRITVVNFWATWCGPCVRELPALAAVSRRYADRGVVVVGVSTDDIEDEADRARVEAFARERGVEYELRYDGTTRDMAAFGFGTALPATAIVDAEGNVVARFPKKVTRRRLSRELDRALAGELVAPADPHGHGEEEDHDHGEEHDHGEAHGHEDEHDHGDEHDHPAAPPRGKGEASLVPS